jgi:hypothetical protein
MTDKRRFIRLRSRVFSGGVECICGEPEEVSALGVISTGDVVMVGTLPP